MMFPAVINVTLSTVENLLLPFLPVFTPNFLVDSLGPFREGYPTSVSFLLHIL